MQMGLQFEDLFRACLGEMERGRLKEDFEFDTFWEQLKDARKCSQLLLVILNKLTAMMKDAYKHIKKKRKGPVEADWPVSSRSVTNTIAFMLFNTPQQLTDARFTKFFADWNCKEVNKALPSFPHVKEVIRTLSNMCENKDIWNPAMIGCCTLHSLEELQAMSDVFSSPGIRDQDVQSGEASFIYPHLIKHCREDMKNRDDLWFQLSMKFAPVPGLIKIDPRLAETTLQALLQMAEGLLHVAPISTKQAKLMIQRVTPFFYWPNPYGSAARDYIFKLKDEMMFPGVNLRRKMEEAFTAAAYIDATTSLPTDVVHFLTPHELSAYSTVMKMQESKEFQPNPDIRVTASAHANSLLSMIQIDKVDISAEVTAVKGMNRATLAEFMTKAHAIENKIITATDESVAATDRKTAMDALCSEIQASVPSNSPANVVLNPNYVPALPVVNPGLAYFEIDDMEAYFKDLQIDDTRQKQAFLQTAAYDRLSSVVKSYADAKTKQYVKVCIMGGDRAVMEILSAYCLLKQQSAEQNLNTFDNLVLEFFLLPIEASRAAGFIGRFDSWYHRHILAPTRTNNYILPWIEAGSDLVVKKRKPDSISLEVTPPGKFLRSLVTHYVREACNTFNFVIFELLAWKTIPTKGQLPDVRIPFICGVSIGLRAAAKLFKVRRALPDSQTLAEVQKNRNFVFKPVTVDMELDTVTADGCPTGEETENIFGVTVDEVSLFNIPTHEYGTFPKNPNQDFLEMLATLTKGNTDSKSSVLSASPQQHVQKIKLSCSDAEGTMDVIIDEQLLPPLHTIHIQPLRESDDGVTSTFPIKTFFPLDFK